MKSFGTFLRFPAAGDTLLPRLPDGVLAQGLRPQTQTHVELSWGIIAASPSLHPIHGASLNSKGSSGCPPPHPPPNMTGIPWEPASQLDHAANGGSHSHDLSASSQHPVPPPAHPPPLSTLREVSWYSAEWQDADVKWLARGETSPLCSKAKLSSGAWHDSNYAHSSD